ncbi:MAG: mechanosensitive ion channel [Chthoniobacteraceae bacterium]
MNPIEKITNFDDLKAFLLSDGLTIGLRILSAVLILFVGWWGAKLLRVVFRRLLLRVRLDGTIAAFLSSLGYVLILTFTLVAAVDQLGVATTSIITALGAAGLAVGLALQGSLSNFASGVLIVLLRPFRADDTIQTGAFSGTVQEIGIFFTILRTSDNRRVFLPNSTIMNAAIVNFSTEELTRRIELSLMVSYDSDATRASALLLELVKAESRIHTSPGPEIGITNLGMNGAEIAVRVWVNSGDYTTVTFDLLRVIKERFDAEKIVLARQAAIAAGAK